MLIVLRRHASEIGAGDQKDLAFGAWSVDPLDRQLGESRIDQVGIVADLYQKQSLRVQVFGGFGQQAPHDIEAVVAGA